MPAGVDVNAVLSEVPETKDVDGINPFTPERKRIAHAPVVLAVMEILARTNTPVQGSRVVVVGAGRLVGQPTAAHLRDLGAKVTMFTLDQGSIRDLLDADIIVSGAGQPHFIKPEHVSDGVVLIDAGASESDDTILGDADPACAEKARVFTPVPGGVGPISVAMIFRNLLDLKRAASHT
jgi:methylenetetrahydrofolate dehydrogenase (NADP+)/methenyltetrahydrofolate cyclohydrolase